MDLLFTRCLMGVSTPTDSTPGTEAELQTSVVPVPGVDRPVAVRLARSEPIPHRVAGRIVGRWRWCRWCWGSDLRLTLRFGFGFGSRLLPQLHALVQPLHSINVEHGHDKGVLVTSVSMVLPFLVVFGHAPHFMLYGDYRDLCQESVRVSRCCNNKAPGEGDNAKAGGQREKCTFPGKHHPPWIGDRTMRQTSTHEVRMTMLVTLT